MLSAGERATNSPILWLTSKQTAWAFLSSRSLLYLCCVLPWFMWVFFPFLNCLFLPRCAINPAFPQDYLCSVVWTPNRREKFIAHSKCISVCTISPMNEYKVNNSGSFVRFSKSLDKSFSFSFSRLSFARLVLPNCWFDDSTLFISMFNMLDYP